MREVIRTLKIDGMEVIEERAEKIEPRMIGLFSEVVCRALGSPDLFLRISFPLLSTGSVGFSERRLEQYDLPIGGEKRTLLIYVK